MLFIISFFMLLCIGFSVRKNLDKNVYTPVDPYTEYIIFHSGEA